MKHKHHIIPKHMGGTDDPSNIIELTIEEHAKAHKELYEKFGKKEDWLAWKGLEGSISKEDIIFTKCSIAGKHGVEKLKTLKICSFYNEELRLKAAAKGLEVCREKKLGFYDPKVQSDLGKRGGPKNLGFIWINDGSISIKYTKKMQNNKCVEDFIKDNPKFSIGRLQTHDDAQCPHCNKIGKKGGMMLHHFDNCYVVTNKKRTFKMSPKSLKKCPHCDFEGSGGAMMRFHFNNCKRKIHEN